MVSLDYYAADGLEAHSAEFDRNFDAARMARIIPAFRRDYMSGMGRRRLAARYSLRDHQVEELIKKILQ